MVVTLDNYNEMFGKDHHLKWYNISYGYSLSTDFIDKFKDKIHWGRFTRSHTDLTISFIRKYKDYLDWLEMSIHCKLSLPMLIEFKDYLDWDILTSKKIVMDNLEYFEDVIHYGILSNKPLNIQQLNKYKHKLRFDLAVRVSKLSQNLLIEKKEDFNDVTVLLNNQIIEENTIKYFLPEIKDYLS